MNLPKPIPNSDSPPPRIVCAANRHNQSLIIVCGARHFDSVMEHVIKHNGGYPYWNDCECGFIDQYGNFYTREEAWIVANENGQIAKRIEGVYTDEFGQIRKGVEVNEGILYSENLY